MKIILWLGIGFSLLMAGCQTSPTKMPCNTYKTKHEGLYIGTITSVGMEFPGTTRLSRDINGKISGTYEFMETNENVKGTLKNCRFINDETLHCQWFDKYGRGDLNMIFNTDASHFNGQWNSPGEKETYSWEGTQVAK